MEGPQEISAIAKSLNRNKPEEVLSANYVIDQFEPKVIHKYIDELLDIKNMCIIIGDTNFQISDKDPNKDFFNNNNLNIKSDIYRIDYAQ